jgi:hypothetical protein
MLFALAVPPAWETGGRHCIFMVAKNLRWALKLARKLLF